MYVNGGHTSGNCSCGREVLKFPLNTVLFLPTVVHCAVFIHSHISSWSYAFRCLTKPSAGTYTPTAVP